MIKIHSSKDGQTYYTVNGRNGKVIVTSETYRRKRNCVFGVAALIRALRNPKIIDQTVGRKKSS
jgi:uncharacterized protein YegP (UPF0339 family)